MPCCEISDNAQMSKIVIAVWVGWSRITRNCCDCYFYNFLANIKLKKSHGFGFDVLENSLSTQGICNCSEGWMGEACQDRCIHGKPTDDYKCECEPCYNGLDCSTICSNKSNLCVKGECDCGFNGWRGEFCERRGCPGVDEDCSGHGTCFADTQTCICDSGWSGEWNIVYY